MAWIRWGLLLSFGLFLSPVCVSVERQQSRSSSGFRRLYVLQPGPVSGPAPGAAGDGGVRVTSISTRHGAAGQPLTYNVELTANVGRQVRTRRMGILGNQAAPAPQVVRQSGQQQNQQPPQLLKLSG